MSKPFPHFADLLLPHVHLQPVAVCPPGDGGKPGHPVRGPIRRTGAIHIGPGKGKNVENKGWSACPLSLSAFFDLWSHLLYNAQNVRA